MTSDLLVELLQELDGPQHRYTQLENYFQGNSPLSYLSAEAKAALAKFDRMSSNLCRTAVLSLGERLRLSGFDGDDRAWPLFLASELDQLSAGAHQRALLWATCPILVWADSQGRPRATVESPRQMIAQHDPVTRDITAAVKRVRTKTTTEAWVYLPNEVQHHRAQTPGAATAGFDLVESIPNPLGVVPVAELGNECEDSVITDLIPLQDLTSKLLLDLAVTSEYAGRPRRWATGIELVEKPMTDDDGNPILDAGEPVMETVNPFPEANRMMVSENEGAKIGQLAATDLAGFEAGIRVAISQAMMVSGLPAHYVGLLQDAVTSADALRAAEAALVARAEAKQRSYGTGWERTGNLLLAVATGTNPDAHNVRVKWAPADTRSQAQEADAAVKLYQAGVLSRRAVLRTLGLTEDEIAAELAEPTQENPNA